MVKYRVSELRTVHTRRFASSDKSKFLSVDTETVGRHEEAHRKFVAVITPICRHDMSDTISVGPTCRPTNPPV